MVKLLWKGQMSVGHVTIRCFTIRNRPWRIHVLPSSFFHRVQHNGIIRGVIDNAHDIALRVHPKVEERLVARF